MTTPTPERPDPPTWTKVAGVIAMIASAITVGMEATVFPGQNGSYSAVEFALLWLPLSLPVSVVACIVAGWRGGWPRRVGVIAGIVMAAPFVLLVVLVVLGAIFNG